jgi:hypothetical protein
VPRNPIPPLIFLAALVAIGGAAWLFSQTEAGRYAATSKVANSESQIRLAMSVRHEKGPIVEEDYRMADLDGLSSSEYKATGRNGTTVRVTSLPHETTDVSFLFDQLVADGIWDLSSKPPRGDTSSHYAIEIYQLTQDKHGSHRFEFTDPHFWATSGGHEFKIHLDRNKPVPDLLTMKSTSLVDERYQKLVDDFTSFGSPDFRSKVASVQARLSRGG